MSADVLDILEIERNNELEVSKDAILGTNNKPKKRSSLGTRKPEGMAREVYNLYDRNDPPPLFMTDFKPSAGGGYMNVKANLGIKKVRSWRFQTFENPARKDSFKLHHWARVADEGKEYAFCKFNKEVAIPSYTDQEYQQNLMCNTWTKAETDYLFDMARRFDLRFIIIKDRWDRKTYQDRSVEDIKDRYYSICNTLKKIRAPPGTEVKIQAFDADHERRRKEQLDKLLSRTPEEVEEEQNLIQELRKIDLRKKERERKTQDLQKMIQDNEQRASQPNQKKTSTPAPSAPKKKKEKSSAPSSTSLIDIGQIELSAAIKFPELKVAVTSLRSARMKLPQSIGQKKTKALEQMLKELNVDPNPPAFEDVVQHFNDLRNCMVLLYELKQALTTSEYEKSTLRLQFQEQVKTEATAADSDAGGDVDVMGSPPRTAAGSGTSNASIADAFEVELTPNRKRKAALEQMNVMRKLKKM
ncbi:DNA methyltransferase 1-associated protein 1-like [Varroa jacobsoni]|uniref:DNA methyltransferase 1-associated protein 1 n=1 Tax=Varroa destructor TaxID=109461 RepID=A0A7M7JPJ5_VARDE|nr:DNA methyltransferase 1-associated protein 1-like [Varroa destructor]XP_022705164.1 DNA methyltransferase 1-associated protein 1-like [Varroa jacobsoni]